MSEFVYSLEVKKVILFFGFLKYNSSYYLDFKIYEKIIFECMCQHLCTHAWHKWKLASLLRLGAWLSSAHGVRAPNERAPFRFPTEQIK